MLNLREGVFGPCEGVLRLVVDFADKYSEKSLLMSMGGRAEGLACADLVSKTPIGMSGNYCELKFVCQIRWTNTESCELIFLTEEVVGIYLTDKSRKRIWERQ